METKRRIGNLNYMKKKILNFQIRANKHGDKVTSWITYTVGAEDDESLQKVKTIEIPEDNAKLLQLISLGETFIKNKEGIV